MPRLRRKSRAKVRNTVHYFSRDWLSILMHPAAGWPGWALESVAEQLERYGRLQELEDFRRQCPSATESERLYAARLEEHRRRAGCRA